jgi:hypothetical protein
MSPNNRNSTEQRECNSLISINQKTDALLCKQGAAGSIPATSTNLFNHLRGPEFRYLLSQQGVTLRCVLNP